ncbi:DUF3047 domain-containing protein [Roseateles oligotrophus]|uniref:DUF3047 domain-containing protein n=1 Tax=Roseateles oligotrophus TaxID=1769250 RepID=A0ABT2YET5_9BURK|nr:DUF3047 domain-containing protein [Roseateles oligotrophus]MCV2368533.1 DUF3047 domain-containing protein [Roseateles oligotrophus]
MPAELADWSARELPGKRSTEYSMGHRGGQDCVLAKASQSVSLWRRSLKIESEQLAALQFDWWIQALDLRATVLDPDTDDAPARLLLGFDGDESRLSLRNRMQFELVQTLTGEPPPFATLMYVWDANAAPETVLISARSDRIRKIVVGSGLGGQGRWQRLRRDVRADYIKAFGETPGRLSSMAMMTDGDNTRSRAEACYGNILLLDTEQQALKGSLQL